MSEFLLELDGYTDETMKGSEVERYKGRKDVTDRIAFVYRRDPLSSFPKDKLERLKARVKSGDVQEVTIEGTKYILQAVPFAARVHYDQRKSEEGGLGYFFCRSSMDKREVCCEKFGSPSVRMAAIIVQYASDKYGKPNSPLSYNLKLWVFSEDRFVSLRAKNNEWPLVNHDITVKCTEDKYQKLDITPCKENLWRMKPELESKIYEESVELYAAAEKALGRERSIEEIRESLGLNAATPAQEASTEEIADLLAGWGSSV